MQRAPSAPIPSGAQVERRATFRPLWHAAAAIPVVLAPSQLYFGIPFWRLAPERVVQCIVMGAAYLAVAVFLRWQGGEQRYRLLIVLVACAVAFGAGYLFFLARPDINYSRVLILISAALGTALAILPSIRSRLHLYSLLTLGVTSAAFIGFGVGSSAGMEESGPKDRVLATALKSVSLTYLRKTLDPFKGDGGGITRFGDGFLLATGSGEIYRLQWEAGKNALKPTRLALSAPMDRTTFLADQPEARKILRLRITDIAVDSSAAPATLYVAHQNWNREGKCFTATTVALSCGPTKVTSWYCLAPIGNPRAHGCTVSASDVTNPSPTRSPRWGPPFAAV